MSMTLSPSSQQPGVVSSIMHVGFQCTGTSREVGGLPKKSSPAWRFIERDPWVLTRSGGDPWRGLLRTVAEMVVSRINEYGVFIFGVRAGAELFWIESVMELGRGIGLFNV